MSDANEPLLREEGFAFCGAITASLSHEITNVFATINELSGLLDDFFHASEQGHPLDVKRLMSTTQRIASQVERGQRYVKRLNRFAHTVDGRESAVPVNEHVEAMAVMCRRFGTLRRVELQTSLPDASPTIAGCPFDLQHIVFRCIDVVLAASHEGDVLRIAVETEKGDARLVFSNDSALESVEKLKPRLDFLSVLLTSHHCTVESTLEAGQPVRLSVSLPRSLSGEGDHHG